MKKLIVTVGLMLVGFNSSAQWTYQVVDNGFDEKYRIAYTETNNNGFLKLENVDGDVLFYLRGGYFCDDNQRCTGRTKFYSPQRPRRRG
jgi:hypothetical protein